LTQDIAVKSEPTVDQLSAAIRSAYVLAVRRFSTRQTGIASQYGAKSIPQWDGGTDAYGRVHKAPVWAKIAAFSFDNGIDPLRLIDVVFAGWNKPVAPYPTFLMTTEALSAYGKIEQIDRDAAAVFKAQTMEFTDRVDFLVDQGTPMAIAVRKVLLNRQHALSALFRYVAALQVGLPEVALVFRDEAIQRYLFNRAAIDKAWGDMIPAILVTEADSTIKAIYASQRSQN
jgi:hypothetical protein